MLSMPLLSAVSVPGLCPWASGVAAHGPGAVAGQSGELARGALKCSSGRERLLLDVGVVGQRSGAVLGCQRGCGVSVLGDCHWTQP